MILNKYLFFFFFSVLVANLNSFTYAEDRDPFLSPFEPKKVVPKEEKKEIENIKLTTEKSISLLDDKKIQEIKSLINTNQPEKAGPLLIEYKKILEGQTLGDADKTILSDFEEQITNFEKLKEYLKTTRALMTVQGKVILNDKKNILLINNEPVAEGEDLSTLLKLETSVFLKQVKEDSFSLQYKDIILPFHIE